ncbi:MAG: 7-cyano-7-deazaguanine synthase, partial [Pseudomonadota bacterium]
MNTACTSTIPAGGGRPCILLLSGGLDSTTLLAAIRNREWDVSCLTFRYGQRHEFEIEAAGKAGRKYGCRRHVVIDMPLSLVAASALTSDSIDVPPGGESEGIPVTYVPARNLAFLSVAISWAESLALQDIFIAVSSVDYSGYPDGRRALIRAFEEAAARGTKTGVEGKRIFIHAP